MNTITHHEIDHILDANERVLWSGKPKFIAYLFRMSYQPVIAIFSGSVWILINRGIKAQSDDFIFGHFWMVGLLIIAGGIFTFVKSLLAFTKTSYAFTDKRIIIKGGIFGPEFRIVDYDKVIEMELKVNFIERIYDLGTIQFFSGKTKVNDDVISKVYDSIIGIYNPYEVFKLLKKTSTDIKTDFSYPNALRPDTNPGYNTTYKND